MKDVSQNSSLHDTAFMTGLLPAFFAGAFFLAAAVIHVGAVQAADEAEAVEQVSEQPVVAEAASAEAAAPAAAKKEIVLKSAVVFAMPSKIIHKNLVQDLLRVGERLFLVGERGHIAWSDDNAVSWQQAKVPTIQDITAIYFVTQEQGWAVGHDGNIFNTIDGGKTWAMQLDGLAYNLVRAQSKVEKYNAQLTAKQEELAKAEEALEAAQAAGKKKTEKLELAVEELSEVVDELDFQVRDAHKILEDENAPWPLMDVWFSDINNGFAVGAFNAFLMTSDGGKTWQDVSGRLENPDGLHLNVIVGNTSTILIGGEAGLLFRSRDAGATWESLESPDDGSFYAMNVRLGGSPDALDIWAVGMEGSTFHSTDSGSHWELVDVGISNNLNSVLVDESGLVLIVGNDGTILRSTDSGKTFESHRRQDQATMSSVAVAANGDYVFAGVGGILAVKPAEWNRR